MYLLDLFKRLIQKANIPILLYLTLNVLIISGVFHLVFGNLCNMPFWQSLLISIGFYAVSLMIALSPVGEFILRLQTRCRKIKDQNLSGFLNPIFEEVYSKAKELDPSIPDGVKLFVCNDEGANAFATGRKTICVTRGLLGVPKQQVKATLAHEFGHLAHKDTDLILLISVGNVIISGIISVFHIILGLIHFVVGFAAIFAGKDGVIPGIINGIHHFLISIFVIGLTKIWTWIGKMLVLKSCRSNEFAADKFALDLGYGNDLCALLESIGSYEGKGLFATLASSHPKTKKRIERLQKEGATYNTAYNE